MQQSMITQKTVGNTISSPMFVQHRCAPAPVDTARPHLLMRSHALEARGIAQYVVNLRYEYPPLHAHCTGGAFFYGGASSARCVGWPAGHAGICCEPILIEELAARIRRSTQGGVICLGECGDAWSPEGQEHDLGRRLLAAVLDNERWHVCIVTRNTAVESEFDLIQRLGDRAVLCLGMSTPPGYSKLVELLEPGSSSVEQRLQLLAKAARHGLRVDALVRPVIPGLGTDHESLDALVCRLDWSGVEALYVEPIRPIGVDCLWLEHALQRAGLSQYIEFVWSMQDRTSWSQHVYALLRYMQLSVAKYMHLSQLRFAINPLGLHPRFRRLIERVDQGVIWLDEWAIGDMFVA